MRTTSMILTAALALGGAASLQAQTHPAGHETAHGPGQHAAHGSPYADFTGREIKALAPGEVSGLEAGHGLGMALAAELNGYPGPRHVLDLAETLALSGAQRQAVQKAFDVMAAKARSLGREVVEGERRLDRAFADGSITPERLDELVEAIGERRARLRAAHLAAHLEVAEILTAEQRQRYAEARGYAR